MLRSRMMSNGLEKELEAEAESAVKSVLDRLATCSRRRASSLRATISAAPPRGQRTIGSCPSVATTEKSPRAIRSTTSSTDDSLALAELSSSYAVGVTLDDVGAAETGSPGA